MIKLFFKNKKRELDMNNIPKHIAFIMDGNGRWAKKRMLPRSAGHREGAQAIKKVCRACGNLGVEFVTLYAFSTENWKRPQDEVDAIMDLLLNSLRNAEKELDGEEVKIKVIGDVKPLSEEIKKEIERVENVSKDNTKLTLNLAINYGSRNEIVEATKKITNKVLDNKISLDDIDEKLVSENLYTFDCPDPELLVRSSGEQRISNYLLWQLAYAEFVFDKTLWPDFSEKQVVDAIYQYQNRDRRFGGIKK